MSHVLTAMVWFFGGTIISNFNQICKVGLQGNQAPLQSNV
jgi:hypothetical protein